MSTSPSDQITKHAIVKYNDGEGLVHTDLLNGQNYMRAAWMDLLMAGYSYDGTYPRIYGADSSDLGGDDTLFVPRAGQAMVRPHASGLSVNLDGGWVGQLNSAFSDFDGSTPRLLMAFINATDLGSTPHFTHDAADPTNARIDLIQVRLTEVDDDNTSRDFKDAITSALSTTLVDKKTRIQIEFDIKNGTPSANPVAPAPDAGWAEMTRVRIPATSTGPLALDDIIDVRMPMRTIPYRVTPPMMGVAGAASTWVQATGQVVALTKSSGGATDAIFCFTSGWSCQRIIGVWLSSCGDDLLIEQ